MAGVDRRMEGGVRYKLVIFDFDGTLADSFPYFMSIVNELADRFRFKRVEESEVDALRGYSARELIKHTGVSMWKLPLIAVHARRRMAKDIEQVALFEGVDEMLRGLTEKGVKLAVVTSNSRENVRRVLGPENAALIQYWECGVGIFGKQAQFRKVLKRSGVLPGEALCVGDEIRDIEAAKGANIACGAVAWGFATVEALVAHGPTEVFGSMEEIVERVG
jgi:phosphoglycolate phosphatase